MADLEREIRELTAEFTRDIVNLLRASVLESLKADLGGGAVSAGRVGRRKAATRADSSSGEKPLAGLSDRERTVLVAIASGKTTNAVAAELGLSPRTVETYRLRIRRKIGEPAKSVAGMTQWALAHGLISL